MEAVESQSTQGQSGQQGQPAYEQCDHCGAPVDQGQRYCVECGAHRRHVHDPAARYLATATARTRTGSGAIRSPAARRRRSYPLGVALAIAAIPLAAGLGLLVGRGSNNGDGKLIGALRAQRPEIITASAGAAPASVGASVTRVRGRRNGAAAASGKVLSKTAFGTAHQIVGSKPTTAQLATGAQVVRHIQQTEGKSYVSAQRGLPDQISVP